MSPRRDATEDPLPAPRGSSSSTDEPLLEVVFHSDLRRIGEVARLPPARAVVVGRSEPMFERSGSAPSPLLDPCISRRQLTVRWLGEEEGLELFVDDSARRDVFILTDGASRVVPRGRAVVAPVDSLLAVGDRVLLRARSGAVAVDDLGVAGDSRAMRDVRARVLALGPREETVLVLGESGTGKELVARALHASSAVSGGPFVAVNCAALPDSLLESELFGHTRGAFTGADEREGLFRAADGGTLFLDEIGELSLTAQAKLLRVLQDRRVRPVGAERDVSVRVRVVAATHQRLHALAAEGRFRLDFLARIDGLVIDLPPLRARGVDVALLLARFLLAAPGFPPSLVREADQFAAPVPFTLWCDLLRHPWPGNVRQVERWVAATAGLSKAHGAFVAADLPLGGSALGASSMGAGAISSPRIVETGASRPRERPDRAHLVAALDEHGHVQHRVARALGIPPATLDRWLRELGIRRPRDLSEEDVRRAQAEVGDDLEAMAAALSVSPRGLRLRLNELGLKRAGAVDASARSK